MTGPGLPAEALVRRAVALEEAWRALVEEGRRAAAVHGVEVVDVRPARVDGVWEVRLRLRGGGAPDPGPVGASSASPPERWAGSAARTARPFEGDGTADVLRFVAEADPATRVPAPPGTAGPAPRLSVEDRLRMLPAAIADEALLGVGRDVALASPEEVDAALARGRRWYASEVDEAGVGESGPFLALYDAAAAGARRRLLGAA